MCHTRGPSDQTICGFNGDINIESGGLIVATYRFKGNFL